MRYIEDLRESDTVVGHYLCKQRQSLKSRAGKTYLSLKLQDKTGQIDAKVWELNNDIQSFEENDFIKIDATVVTFQNELQLKINKLRKSAVGEYDEMNYIPATDKDINSMYAQLTDYIKTLSNPFIRKLLENIFIKNEKTVKFFKNHSAAKSMHHSYMGGLLEHTLWVVNICDFMCTRYKYVNRDILIAAGMLHDLGKIYELSEFPDNDYTDAGQLLGHIMIGVEIITEEMNKIPNFPERLKTLLKHCIVSHHGEYEFGSPKRPKIIEAFILHWADNMDSKVKMFEEAIESDNTQGNWMGYHKLLLRNISKSDF